MVYILSQDYTSWHNCFISLVLFMRMHSPQSILNFDHFSVLLFVFMLSWHKRLLVMSCTMHDRQGYEGFDFILYLSTYWGLDGFIVTNRLIAGNN